MLAWLGALLLLVGFVALCRQLGLVTASRRVLAVTEQAIVVLGDKSLDDDAKERSLRGHALSLFRYFAWLALGGLTAFFAPLGVLWLADRVGWLDWDATLAVAMSWTFIGLTCAIAIIVLIVQQRRARARAQPREFENRYSATDRVVHQIAFSTIGAQLRAGRLEDRLHRARLSRITVERPVFIAALPRAGTTLLLELCAQLGEFVTHTYRRMPFVLTPLLWEKTARAFRRDVPVQERAHGDGMLVGLDSPEAFEEVLWLAYWADHYRIDRIEPWRADETAAGFPEFFRQHIRKLIAVSGRDQPAQPVRYISKNNLNIARIPWLLREFSDARVVVPFRTPLQHAASLLRQHRNFQQIHGADPFAARYMAAIGHFDFGANLRPVNFGGWLNDRPVPPAESLEFWLRYWTACYQQLSEQAQDRVHFFDFDAFCAAPRTALEHMAHFLAVRDGAELSGQHSRIHTPRPHAVPTADVSPHVLAAAVAVHARLTEVTGSMAADARMHSAHP